MPENELVRKVDRKIEDWKCDSEVRKIEIGGLENGKWKMENAVL